MIGDETPSLPTIFAGRAPVDGSPAQKIGIVAAVTGARLSCRLLTGGQIGPSPSSLVHIGSLVKVPAAKSTVYGLVGRLGLSLEDEHPGEAAALAEIDLIGETTGANHFSRGISNYPRLDTPVLLASAQELANIYSRQSKGAVQIGTLYQDPSVAVQLLTEEFLAKHSAVIGTTGTGKSCALALILRSLLTAHSNGHVVMIDPHGEYSSAFRDMGECLSAKDLQLPYWILNYEEIVEILCSKDPNSRNREAAILRDAVIYAKREALKKTDPNLVFTVDTPVPYQLTSLVQYISEAMGKLDRPDHTPLPYLRLLDTIDSIRRDERFRFMFGHLAMRDDFAEIVARILRIPVLGRPITIVDISSLPPEITDVVVSILCRLVFDFARWSTRAETVPVLFVFDEAHRYIPRDPNAGFEPTRRSISRIAKEGRKYGISLCLVTQRPSEIAESVLSQCSTIFAFRLVNQTDQEFVDRAVSDGAAGLLRSLPTLGPQEAIAVGEGIAHAMRLRFNDLPSDRRPMSVDKDFATAWASDNKDRRFIDSVIRRWRHLSFNA